MSSTTNKRTNEDTESEPAAKRKAVADPEKEEKTAELSSNHLESISSAQEAFDRLDFKSAQEICTQIIDADPTNAKALILRSISSERRGQFKESIEDAETAIKVRKGKDLEPYVRCAFAHLGTARHLLGLGLDEIETEDGQGEDEPDVTNDGQDRSNQNGVQEETQIQEDAIMEDGMEPEKEKEKAQEEDIQEAWLQELDLEGMIGTLESMKAVEIKGPFRRVTSELFVQMASHCDSPTLVKSMAVCKSWNSSVSGSPDLFCQFKMEGNTEQITKGIKFFSSKCSNSIEVIDLKVNDSAKSSKLERLKRSIKPSLQTIRELSIDHSGHLCQLIIDLAAEAPMLSILSSYKGSVFNVRYTPLAASVVLPTSWKPRIERLVWNIGNGIQTDQNLLNALQGVKSVNLSSGGIGASFVLKLLSSTPSLEKLWIPFMEQDQQEVEDFPFLDLPNLVTLLLQHVPKSRLGQGSRSFFKNLQAPNLSYLRLGLVDPEGIALLDVETAPEHFDVLGLVGLGTEDAEAIASAFINSIKDWNHLQVLNLSILKSRFSSTFWNQILCLLSPLSKESVQAGYRDHLVLPYLEELGLGRANPPSSRAEAISGQCVASFIASRKAMHRGLSTSNVMFSAMGDLQASSSAPAESKKELPFKNKNKCSSIKTLRINFPIKMDTALESWIKEEVDFRSLPTEG